MTSMTFNFNHERELTDIELNQETGVVTVTVGTREREFASIQEFAETFAVARNVLPENLKNWHLSLDGDQYTFEMNAGTAGLGPDDITSLVRGLQAAGMSPEEIGRAVASAQATETAEPVAQTGRTEFVDEILRAMADYTDTNKALIRYFTESDILEEAADFLSRDESFRAIYDEAVEDAEEDDEFFFNDVDPVDEALSQWFAGERDELFAYFPGVNEDLVIEIVLQQTDNTVAEEALDNARFAAEAAGRTIHVALIKDEGGEAAEVTFAELGDDTYARFVRENGRTLVSSGRHFAYIA